MARPVLANEARFCNQRGSIPASIRKSNGRAKVGRELFEARPLKIPDKIGSILAFIFKLDHQVVTLDRRGRNHRSDAFALNDVVLEISSGFR